MSALWKAMLDAQKEIKHAVKDAKNPHFKNDYATLQSTLDAVKPALNKNGLVLTQEIRHGNQPEATVRVTTRIVHAASGEQTSDAQVIPIVKNDPQGHGSAITYARRYAIQSMLGIASEDDDGESASQRPPERAAIRPERAPVSRPNDGAYSASQRPTVGTGTVVSQPVATQAEIESVTKKLQSALGFKKI